MSALEIEKAQVFGIDDSLRPNDKVREAHEDNLIMTIVWGVRYVT